MPTTRSSGRRSGMCRTRIMMCGNMAWSRIVIMLVELCPSILSIIQGISYSRGRERRMWIATMSWKDSVRVPKAILTPGGRAKLPGAPWKRHLYSVIHEGQRKEVGFLTLAWMVGGGSCIVGRRFLVVPIRRLAMINNNISSLRIAICYFAVIFSHRWCQKWLPFSNSHLPHSCTF